MSKIPLAHQITATGFALTRLDAITGGTSVQSMRAASAEQADLEALQAARETLRFCANPLYALEGMLQAGRDPAPVSLNQQIEAMDGAIARQREIATRRRIAADRSPQRAYDKRRLGDAYRTLQIINERRDEIVAIRKAAGG